MPITIWNESKDGQQVDTVHGHTTRRAKALDSMEDAAQEACIHYHGRRYEAMKEDPFKFLPHHDATDGTWMIRDP